MAVQADSRVARPVFDVNLGTMQHTTCRVLGIAATVLMLAGCGADDPEVAWGTDAESFFAAWSDSWAVADPYDVVRYYDPDVAVILAEDYRSLSLNAGYLGTSLGGDGRLWLADWIDAQFEPRKRQLEGLYLGDSEALTVTLIPEVNTAMAVALKLGDGLITEYTDLRWRSAHLAGGAPDPRLGWLDDLVAGYLADRPDGDFSITTLVVGDRTGPAVFVGPGQAAFVIATTAIDDCRAEFMVSLSLDERVIVGERLLPTVETVRSCFDGTAPAGWDDLAIPPGVGEQITGVLAGTGIEIFNGNADLEKLLQWGLDRFADSGLTTPRLRSATFAPVPTCALAPGVVIDGGEGGAALTLCTDAHQACLPDRETCSDFRAADRLGMLHELSHAWLLENLDTTGEAAFLDLNGLTAWLEGEPSWHLRGAEQAAETLAWGLLEEPIRLVRIGDPACARTAAGYELLTGLPSPHNCNR
jgi:hypothetical protein